MEDLIKKMKSVKSRVSDSKPATAEARLMMDQLERISQTLEQLQPSPNIESAWTGMRPTIAKLEQAFGMVPVP